jgi:hypothetical protein
MVQSWEPAIGLKPNTKLEVHQMTESICINRKEVDSSLERQNYFHF